MKSDIDVTTNMTLMTCWYIQKKILISKMPFFVRTNCEISYSLIALCVHSYMFNQYVVWRRSAKLTIAISPSLCKYVISFLRLLISLKILDMWSDVSMNQTLFNWTLRLSSNIMFRVSQDLDKTGPGKMFLSRKIYWKY